MDSKVLYLAKTLSRTKRKDYENYVVNAIWNRINNPDLIPVTQQYIKAENGNYYFIDLYFPQLKIGIECDESYHRNDTQHEKDENREITIFDILKQIDEKDYLPLHVDVTQAYSEVEKQINSHVDKIKRKIAEQGLKDDWKLYYPCDEKEINEYFNSKEWITVDDNITFPTNKEVYNIILGQNLKTHLQHSGERFKKLYTEYGYEEGFFPWFPKLTVDNKPTNSGYYNRLSNDGKEIFEKNKSHEVNMQRKSNKKYIGKKRVVFTLVKDSITGIAGYRFVGIFVGDHYDETGEITYKRVDDKFKIIRTRECD